MTHLLDQVRGINEDAALELESAGVTTDSDIRSLNRQDLLELLPGKDKLKVRKKIHELICALPQPSGKKHSINDILENIRGLIPPDTFANALSENGPLLEYLRVLKNQKFYILSMLEHIDAQIDLLESGRGNHNVRSSNRMYATTSISPVNSVAHTSATNASSADSENSRLRSWSLSLLWPLQQRQVTLPKISINQSVKVQIASVLYEMVVSGRTLDKHLDIIERVNGPVPGHQVYLQLKETTDENSQVLIVFCPVVSRAGTDVNAALEAIYSDKPIIIVAMHHLHTPACYPVPTGSNVELGVNIFFHETKGLLECTQNDDAITEMKIKLLEFNTKRSCTNTQN